MYQPIARKQTFNARKFKPGPKLTIWQRLVWYEDKISGKSTKRPGLDALKADIFAGKIKTIIIWKLDRLGRTMIEAMNLIADWCNQDVRLISVTQQIDLNNTIGHMIAAVLLGVAAKPAQQKTILTGPKNCDRQDLQFLKLPIH